MSRGPLLWWNASVCRYRRRWVATEGDDEVDRNEIYELVASRTLMSY